MAQIVNLNSITNTESFIDFLCTDVNLDSDSGSERLINNAFGTWFSDNNDSSSITSGIVDLTYDDSSFYVNFSLNGQVVTDKNLTFNTAFSGSISHQFDAWSYIASNIDLINSILYDEILINYTF